jgi:hypothetical protein
MTQTPVQTWCDRLQAKLMAALDATWERIETSDDAAAIRKARDKARACGDLAAMARKVAAMTPRQRPSRPPAGFPLPAPKPQAAPDRPVRKLDRLKGGGRGRL